MIVTTTESVVGRDIEVTLGAVRGNTIRARNVGRDITQGLRNIVGGELKSYTGLMAEARDEARDRMVAEAEAMGADAVVGVRYVTAEVTQGAAEILAYGTAVKLVGDADADDDAESASASNADVA
ncbi:YbjQ family protein [Haloferax prahovense]|uniref:YbjQ family protein n=1 Tax=Haloferax prahovense TaxID=381852 RepID=UPI0006787E84|nr:YbjQ family protein [Haloferax prahovense]